MGPVSVYRVGAVRADSSHVFGGEARDSDLCHTAWLGWLPLTLVEFAGPGVALVGDTWLTAPSVRSERARHAVSGDVVTAHDAAGELLARRECGLDAYTTRLGGVSPDIRLWASSVAVSVADDLVAQVARLCGAHEAWVECVGLADKESEFLDGCQYGRSGDSPVRQRSARAVRDLQDEQLRLHRLLEAVVRIGVFDPAAVSGEPRRVGRLA